MKRQTGQDYKPNKDKLSARSAVYIARQCIIKARATLNNCEAYDAEGYRQLNELLESLSATKNSLKVFQEYRKKAYRAYKKFK
jgi:hypothetical protein